MSEPGRSKERLVVVAALSQISESSMVKRLFAQGAALTWNVGPQEG